MDQGTEEVYLLHAQILKTLANPRRLMILDTLHGRAMTVGEIQAAVGLPQANVSQHLAALRASEVVVSRRDGNTILYSLASDKIVEACNIFHLFLAERLQRRNHMAAQFPVFRPLLADRSPKPAVSAAAPQNRPNHAAMAAATWS